MANPAAAPAIAAGASPPLAPGRPAPGRAAPDRPAPGPPALVRPGPVRRRRPAAGIPRLARRLAGPVIAVAAWQLACSAHVFTSVEVASPAAVLGAARDLWSQGVLQDNLLISVQRVVAGLALGVAAGVALALLTGLLRVAEDLVDPVIQAARSVPILGLVPLAVIWFGVGETPKVFLIALGCTFPVYINTYAAIRGVDSKLVEAGQVFGLGRLGLIRRVILPGSVPGFLVGLRFALVGAWIIDVVAEEINAQSGLGYLINQAQTTDRTDIMFLCLAIYAIVGLIADALVRLLERVLLSWRAAFAGA
jgi:sulfonate transport system permease protein